MVNQNVIHPYNENNWAIKRNEVLTYAINMGDPWKHYAKWKKVEKSTLYDSIYIKCLE